MVIIRKYEAWIVTFICLLAGISLAWCQNKVIPIIDSIIDIFSVSMSAAGWLSSIFCIMGVITAIPSAYILSKYGAKKCGLIAIMCAIIGAILGVTTNSFTLLMISRVIEGLGVGIISVVSPTLISMWFKPEKRGTPMGLWGSWQMIAQSIAFFLAAPLVSFWHWQGMWIGGIILAVITLILFALLVKVPPEQCNYAEITDDSFSLKDCFSSKSTIFISLAGFFFCTAYFGWFTWIATYWTEHLGINEVLVNKYIGYMCVLEIPIVIVIGKILDKVPERKIVGLISCVLYMIILFISYRMESVSLIIPFIIAYPIVEGGIPTLLWTLIPQSVENPQKSSMAIAMLVLWMNLGSVAGPPLMGYVIETFGWHIGTLPAVLSIGLTLLLILKAKIYDQNTSQT